MGRLLMADATPTYANRQMSDTLARLAHSIWLGSAVAELQGTSDPRGRDRLRADRAGHVHRHTAVVDAVGDLEKEAKRTVWKEVTGLFGHFPADMPAAARGAVRDGRLRRIDLVTVDHATMKGGLVDPAVVDPATPAAVAAAATAADAQPNRVADDEEAVKLAHYPDVPPAFTLSPVVLTTQAGCGTKGQEYLSVLGLALARRRNDTADPRRRQVAAAVREVRERVGVALMRELASQLSASFTGMPHPALADAALFVHTVWRRDKERNRGEAGADGQPDWGEQRAGEGGGRLIAPD